MQTYFDKAKKLGLSNSARLLMAYYMAIMESEGCVRVDHAKASDTLGISYSTVAANLSLLRKMGYLRKIGKKTYTLDGRALRVLFEKT